jgi:hypothetical protein
MKKSSFVFPENGLDKATLKPLLRIIHGGKVGKVRTSDRVGETKTVTSTVDPEVNFTIKRAGNREDVQRANMFSKIEYVNTEEDDGVISRRDFPVGDMQIATIRLCLVDWNLELANGNKVPINEATILDLLEPEERVDLYQEVLDFNPIWSNRDKRKNS